MGRRKDRTRGNGEGSIRQRKDGRWEARISTTTLGGKRRQRSFYGATRDEAAAKLNEALHKQSIGQLVEPDKTTVAAWLERWLDGKRHIASKTRSTYAHALGHITRHLGGVPVQRLKPLQVRDAYTALADEGLSPRTQRYAAMLLKAALHEAVELQVIAYNPAQAVKVKSARVERKADAWTREEVAAFLRAARGELVKRGIGGAKAKGQRAKVVEVPPEHALPCAQFAAFYLMLALGLRRGETLGLRWSDVDLEAGMLRVRQSLSVAGDCNTLEVKAVKTPSSRRSLYLSPDVVRVLKEHRKVQRELFGESILVFTSNVGTPVQPRNLRRQFSAVCELAGVRRVRLHDLRHTYASLALQRGVPAEVVSERLGHASVGFTLDTYRHLYEVERREAAVSLDDLLRARGSAPN